MAIGDLKTVVEFVRLMNANCQDSYTDGRPNFRLKHLPEPDTSVIVFVDGSAHFGITVGELNAPRKYSFVRIGADIYWLTKGEGYYDKFAPFAIDAIRNDVWIQYTYREHSGGEYMHGTPYEQ